MVDTNQESVDSKEAEKAKADKQPVKKKNVAPKRAPKEASAKKGDDKGVVKKLPVKRETTGARSQGAAKPAQGQTVANLKKFVKGAWAELKKVHWPNRRELVTFTGVVLVTVTVVAVMIFAVDSILGKLLEIIIPK